MRAAPLPDRPSGGPRVTRRVLLQRAGALGAAIPFAAALAACTGDSDDGEPGKAGHEGPTSAPDPDAAARVRARTASADLITAYEAALAPASGEVPDGMTALLTPLLADNRIHLTVLGGAQKPTISAPTPARSATDTAAAGTASGPPTTGAATTPPPEPLSPAAVVAALLAAEQAASAANAADAVTAKNGAFARLLASISASQSLHARTLAAGANEVGG